MVLILNITRILTASFSKITDFEELKRENMKLVFKLRTILAIIPLVYSLFFSSNTFIDAPWLLVPGSLCFGAGIFLRIWAQQYLGYRIPRKYRTTRRKKPVTSGPYKLCRNPVYMGNTLIIAGLSAFFGRVQLVALASTWAFFVYHTVITGYEEPHLREKYGNSYARYMTTTGRWIPSPGKLREALRDSSPFPFHLALRFEVHNLGWLLPFVIRYLFFQ